MTAAFSAESGGWTGGVGGVVCSVVGIVRSFFSVSDSEDSLGLFDDLGDPEGLAADPVVAFRVDQELGPDQHQQLAEVDLRDEHLAVASKDLLGVRWERVEMAEVGVGNATALGLESLDRAPDRPVGRAPAEDQQVAAIGAVDLEGRDVAGDPGDLPLAEELHPAMVLR